MDDSKKFALRECQQDLRTGIRVKAFLPTLHSLLTPVEYQLIDDKQLQGNVAMVDELITTLLTKENKHFGGFCSALREHGYAHWADRLQTSVGNAGLSQESNLSPPSVELHDLAAFPAAAAARHRICSAPSSFPVSNDPSTASLALLQQQNEALAGSQVSISSASVILSYVEGVAESDSSERSLELIEEELRQMIDGITEDSIYYGDYEKIDARVEQTRTDIESIFSECFSDEATAGVREATEDKVLVFDELYPFVDTWQERLQTVICHRRTAATLVDLASKVNKLEKHTATAKVAGYSTAIGGTAVFAVGSGLLLGVVTAPAGIPLMAIGGGVGATGSITAIAGCVVKFKLMKNLKKKAQQWLKEHQTLCKSLIVAHDDLMERKAHVERYYPYVKVDEKLAEIFNANIPQALAGVDEIVGNWKKALRYGPEEVVSVITAACGGSASIAQGVLEGVDTGAEVAAVAAKATAKLVGASVAVGLSALMIAVDIGLLAKASYDLHKSLKGKPTKLAKVMNEMAADIERENRSLEDVCCCFIDRQ